MSEMWTRSLDHNEKEKIHFNIEFTCDSALERTKKVGASEAHATSELLVNAIP